MQQSSEATRTLPTSDLRQRMELERRRQLAQAAVTMLDILHLPPNSQNIALMQAYCDNRDPELNRAIEGAIETTGGLDQAACAGLHRRFLSGMRPPESAEAPGQGMTVLIADNAFEEAFARVHHGMRAVRDSAVVATHQIGDRLEIVVQALHDAFLVLSAEARESAERVHKVETRLGRTIGALRSVAARLERAEQFAATDGLTGLPNRRSFDERVRVLVEEAASAGRALSLLMFDVDHFKAFNDRHGHDVGDHVLRLVGKAVASYPGGMDLAARYGGEEFVLLLPGLDRENAVRVGETMREALAERRLTMRGSRTSLGRVTVSVGVAELRPGERPESFVRRADMALYEAKRTGRNRVVVHKDDPAQDDGIDEEDAMRAAS